MSEYRDFEHFGLDPAIIEAIKALGFVKPTPIQSKAIPVILEGRDVMGAAQTGTGKTAGYGLPMLQKIIGKQTTSVSPARHPVRVLVLAPTRELAEQVSENVKSYAEKTLLRVAAAYGGVDIRPQADALRKGVEVLICTPGRLLDHLEQRNVNLSQVEILVLDEADRMLDMGFLPDISRIINQIPKTSQNLMFSATFSPEIKKLAKSFLKDPILIEVARQNATAATIVQKVFVVHESQKTDALVELLKTEGTVDGVQQQAIVFVNAKITARRLARQLELYGIDADSIHGDRSQEERTKTLEAFKEGKVKILVATDVAARGLDIAELPLVINYDVPFNAEDYVHRIGRTGRAASEGLALMLMTGSDENLVEAIEKLTNQRFAKIALNPESARKYIRRREERLATTNRIQTKAYEKENSDPFFSQPYVPAPHKDYSQQAKAAQRREEKKAEDRRQQRSVLLGGFGKKA